MHGLTKVDIEEAKDTIWEALCRGESDREIMDLLGLETEVYKALKFQLLEDRALEAKTRPPEHVYIQYVIDQTRNISDLTDMIAEFKTTKQYNAMVGAIKARAELHDKLIAKGQEFGIFKKVPERREIVAGVMIQDMSRDDLKAAITGAIGRLDSMMRRYGDNDILDVLPEAIHHGPALPPHEIPEERVMAPKAKSKTVRSKMSKSTKGARGRKPFKEAK
ncbi:MAG: hypothetical protein ACWGQW_03675 [bacterium]